MKDAVIRSPIAAFALQLAFGVLAALAGFQSALASDPARAADGYAFLKDRPLPKTSDERETECAWIRSEETRMQSQADIGISTAARFNMPAMAESIKTATDRDLAHLDDRYAQIQCDALSASRTQHVVAPSPAAVARSAAVVAPSPPAVAPAPAVVAPAPAVVAPAPAVVARSPSVVAPSPSVVAPSPPAVAPAPPCTGLTFDQCFAKCRELTDRTKAECFDACRH